MLGIVSHVRYFIKIKYCFTCMVFIFTCYVMYHMLHKMSHILSDHMSGYVSDLKYHSIC